MFEALENNSDDEILIIVPDFTASILRDFILLTYGLLSPENVDQFSKTAILELCQTLGMCSKDVETTTMSNLEEENNVLERKTLSKLEEEVTTEDVERLLNAVEQHQVVHCDPDLKTFLKNVLKVTRSRNKIVSQKRTI